MSSFTDSPHSLFSPIIAPGAHSDGRIRFVRRGVDAILCERLHLHRGYSLRQHPEAQIMPTKEEWDAAWEYNRYARARHRRGKRILIAVGVGHVIWWGWIVLNILAF